MRNLIGRFQRARSSLSASARSVHARLIYGLGAPGATFVVAPHGGANGHCRTVKIPAPWATQYQGAYGDLMVALAAHLKSRAGAYQAVRIIKMTAINESTQETRLPASNGRKAVEGGCSQSDAVSTSQGLGYRPSKVIQAWTRMAASVDRAFPDKLIAMPILERNDFPSLTRRAASPPAMIRRRLVSSDS